MKISVNNKQKHLTVEAVDRALGKLSAGFSRFNNKITSIELTAEDVNGPRGGVDKECRLLIRLRKMDDIVVAVCEESFGKAIAGAIERAQRSVKRKLRRRSLRTSYRKPAFN